MSATITMDLETLEKGIVISKEGRARKFDCFTGVLEGEFVLKLTPDGVKNEFKIGGQGIVVYEKGVSLSKTAQQAKIEAVFVNFYYTILPLSKKNPRNW